jgi:hypothetical protein
MSSYFKHDEHIRIWGVVKHFFQLILLMFLREVVFCMGIIPLIISQMSFLNRQLDSS